MQLASLHRRSMSLLVSCRGMSMKCQSSVCVSFFTSSGHVEATESASAMESGVSGTFKIRAIRTRAAGVRGGAAIRETVRWPVSHQAEAGEGIKREQKSRSVQQELRIKRGKGTGLVSL